MKTFNLKYIFMFLSIAFAFTACVDDDLTDFGTGPVLVQFEETESSVTIIKSDNDEEILLEIPITFFGGRNVPLDRDIDLTIGVSSASTATEGVEFRLGGQNTFTIPAGEKTSNASITILTAGLVPFDFKDVVLEITGSSENVSETNTTTIELKAIGADNLAGTYEVIESNYWRINVERGGWNGATRVIEALSETSYRHKEYAGSFDGNNFYFTTDKDDKITVLTTDPTNGDAMVELNSQPIITCESDASNMQNTVCGSETNYVMRTGDRQDVIYLSYGYLADSGPREFYEVLKRIP